MINIQEEINKTLLVIVEKREEVFKKALDHFNVEKEEIYERVKLVYDENSMEHYHIDNRLVLTFSPLRCDINGKVSMDYKEHYKHV